MWRSTRSVLWPIRVPFCLAGLYGRFWRIPQRVTIKSFQPIRPLMNGLFDTPYGSTLLPILGHAGEKIIWKYGGRKVRKVCSDGRADKEAFWSRTTHNSIRHNRLSSSAPPRPSRVSDTYGQPYVYRLPRHAARPGECTPCGEILKAEASNL